MHLTSTSGERETSAKMKQNAVDAVMSDSFRNHAGDEKTTSRAASYGYTKVRGNGGNTHLPTRCFFLRERKNHPLVFFFFSFSLSTTSAHAHKSALRAVWG